MSEFQLILQHLKQPEYIHVLLNPLPIYGLAMGVLALAVGLLLRSQQAELTGLVVVVVACMSAWPASHYGHRGYDRVYAMSNSDAQQWLDVHAERAKWAVYIYYATAVLALAAMAVPQKVPRAAKPLAVVTLLTAAMCMALGGWTAHAGGQVRHSEFRQGPPAVLVEPHHHEHGIQEHGH